MRTPRGLLATPIVLASCLHQPIAVESLPDSDVDKVSALLREECDIDAYLRRTGVSRPIREGEILHSYVKDTFDWMACNANAACASTYEQCAYVDHRTAISTAFLDAILNGMLESLQCRCGVTDLDFGGEALSMDGDEVSFAVGLEGGDTRCVTSFIDEYDGACRMRGFDCEFSLGADLGTRRNQVVLDYNTAALGEDLAGYNCVPRIP